MLKNNNTVNINVEENIKNAFSGKSAKKGVKIGNAYTGDTFSKKNPYDSTWFRNGLG